MTDAMDFQQVKRIAVAAAYRGGQVLRSYFGNLNRIEKKGEIDLVTEADLESEKAILAAIRNAFPNHTIVAEESGETEGDAACQWLIDPLDGTTNYAHQIGLFAVSIAFFHQQTPTVGVVLNPVTGELFSAISGQGATLNGRPIAVSTIANMSDSLLVTGFPYNLKEMLDPLMQRLTACMAVSQGLRRLGSAALDLCFVACGRFEGFWEQNLKPWDTAAGLVIAREAGAMVTDFADRPFTIEQDRILATNGKIHDEMINLLNLDTIR
jgi:myo-inositol-1(or 4)-monophosphatase